MKKNSTIFLQLVIVILGIGVLTAMLWEPHLEGRNAQATFWEVYFHDPFLAYAYIASISFFVALYQGFKLLGYVRAGKVFSQASVNALRVIKYCAFILAGAIVAADVYLRIAAQASNDDPAGAIMLGMITTFISVVIGAAAAVFQKVLQNAIDLKSENDLIV